MAARVHTTRTTPVQCGVVQKGAILEAPKEVRRRARVALTGLDVRPHGVQPRSAGLEAVVAQSICAKLCAHPSAPNRLPTELATGLLKSA